MSKDAKILIATAVLLGLIILIIASQFWSGYFISQRQDFIAADMPEKEAEEYQTIPADKAEPEKDLHPMAIEAQRVREYPAESLVIEETLANGTNYKQYIASYKSEGLKIFGLLTVPLAEKPANGWPAIIFVHGYIPPKQYSTTGNYATYQPRLARSGFITFKPDLRGHGDSEGQPVSAHFSEKYVVDIRHLISALKKFTDVDPQRIGYWGHSNGAETGLRALVITNEIKAAVFWAGVVGTFEDLLEIYIDQIPFIKDTNNALVNEFGLPSTNPEFWNQIDPYNYLDFITAPIQLQHARGDVSVPFELSAHLKDELEKHNKKVEYYEYPGDNHNITANLNTAWKRTIDFFKENL